MGKFTNIALCVVFVTMCWSSTFVNGETAELKIMEISYESENTYIEMVPMRRAKFFYLGKLYVHKDIPCENTTFDAFFSACQPSWERCHWYKFSTHDFCPLARNNTAPLEYNIGSFFAPPACTVEDKLVCDGLTNVTLVHEYEFPDPKESDRYEERLVDSRYFMTQWDIKLNGKVIFTIYQNLERWFT